MSADEVDWELDALLNLNGQTYWVETELWYKFEARKVKPTPQRPHGIRYSLTIHETPTNERIFGIDNAHGLEKPRRGPGYKRRIEFDHVHEGKAVKAYDYKSATELLEDFFEWLENEMKKRGLS